METRGNIALWDIPDHWEITILSNLGSGKNAIVDGPFGSNLKTSDYIEDSENGVPVLTTKNLAGDYSDSSVRYISTKKYEELKRSKVEPGDILVAKIGSIGKIGIYPQNRKTAIIPANLLKFTVSKMVAFKYVYNYLNYSGFQKFIQGIATATAQPAFNVSKFRALPIPLPPINEQHRIVAKIEELFSELDKGIESLKRAREQLKVYRQALLKHAFEGKLTEQWRKDNADKLESADQLLARIKQAREARYHKQLEEWKAAVKQWETNGLKGNKPRKPSSYKELPPINKTELDVLPALPESWTYYRLAAISQIGSGMSVSKNRKLDTPVEVPYLRVANVQRGSLVLEDVKTMMIEEEKLKDHLLEKWDVLFNEGGDRDKLGRGWVWESQIGQCITQNHVFRATTYLGGEIHSKFVSYWGNTHGQDYFEKGGKQTTNLASINKTVLSMFPVPLPSIEEQEQIIKQLEENITTLDSFEADIETSLQMSESLRQSILKKAFSGQLVAQDPNDEPASVLLERIAAENAQAATTTKKRKAPGRKPKHQPSTAEVLPFKARLKGISTTDLHAGILALAYRHYEGSEKAARNFGHVKGEKIAHLVEVHLGIDLDRNPVKDAAGPNDYPHLMKVESRARKAGFFDVKRVGTRYALNKGRQFDKIVDKCKQALSHRLTEVEALLELLKPLNTRQAEIVATLYAAWNNLLLDGQQPTDEAIVAEARENWHKDKLNIERDKFFRGLQWMRDKGLVPQGKGTKVEAKRGNQRR